VDEFHQRLIWIGLDTLATDDGYALAGGYAVQAHHFVERMSDDVDLFVPIERRHEMPAATARIAAAYEREGLRAVVRHLRAFRAGVGAVRGSSAAVLRDVR
jgi:Nucleotidyl transferase AbiEii toxin, Type IV TA system